jgi:hypothetical protein
LDDIDTVVLDRSSLHIEQLCAAHDIDLIVAED